MERRECTGVTPRGADVRRGRRRGVAREVDRPHERERPGLRGAEREGVAPAPQPAVRVHTTRPPRVAVALTVETFESVKRSGPCACARGTAWCQQRDPGAVRRYAVKRSAVPQ